MRIALAIVTILLCFSGGWRDSAWAQVPVVNIEQRIQQLRPPAEVPLPPEEAILTGREDVVLLQRRDLFSLSASAGYRYTDNAFLSDDFRESDQIFEPTLTLRAGTRLAERYDVFAEVEGFAARYKDNSALDFDAFTGRVGVEMSVDRWSFGTSYSGTPVYESGLGDHLVTLHEFDLNVRHVVPLDPKTVLLPSARASRVFADPDDFSTISGEAGVALAHSLHNNVLGLIGVRGDARRYDDFFENATGETRVDYGVSGHALLVWRPVEWISLSGLVRVTQNWSSVEVNEYHSVELAPTLSLNVRF